MGSPIAAEPVNPPKKRSAGPKRVFGLEITRRCNLACQHCFTRSDAAAHPGTSREALQGLFTQMVALGAEQVAISGGEPLLRKDLELILRDGRERGLRRFTMVTNGSLVTRERAQSLAEAGLVAAQVSVDGVDARDHCKIRGTKPSSFYLALRGIRLLREAGIEVDSATLAGGPNLLRVGEMVALAAALGIRYVRYCSFVPTGRAADGEVRERMEPNPDELDAFLRSARKASSAGSSGAKRRPTLLIDHAMGPWQLDGAFRCVAGRGVAYITAEGDLYPCPSLMHPPFRVGNVYETRLAELLSRPKLHEVRAIPKDALGEPCRSCRNTRCSGGCRGAAYAASGDVKAAPTYCSYARSGAQESRARDRAFGPFAASAGPSDDSSPGRRAETE